MTTDRRIGRKVPSFVRREDAAGVRFDSGPYIGKIKNNLDTARQGRLQVWIPDLGAGDEDDPSNWRTISYASPFFGSTAQRPDDKNNKFKDVRHTYGFWFTPPDIDNFVLCTFIAGDPQRGFWFACVSSQLGQHMVPAIASSKKFDTNGIEDPLVQAMSKDGPLPVTEFNENIDQDWSNFTELKKPIHEIQANILVRQGLDRDQTRGVISSSSQRESPSTVFGISTPGQAVEDKAAGASFASKLKAGTLTPDDMLVYTRKGGHTFVMDDGDFEGKNKLVRLRTSGGHQVIMNDTENVLYISNATGNAWVELSGSGNVSVFSESNINFRSKGNFNFHADKDFSIHTGGTFNLFAKTAIKIETETITSVSSKKTTIYGNGVEIGSQGRIDINPKGTGSFTAGQELVLFGTTIKLNSGKGPVVEKPKPIPVYDLNDAEKAGNGQWQTKPKKLKSIVKIAPSHEPWPREPGTPNPAASSAASASGSSSQSSSPSSTSSGAPNVVSTGSGGVSVNSAGKPTVTGSSSSPDSGPTAALTDSVKNPVDKSYLLRNDNPTPANGVGNLDPVQTKALMTQIAWNESGFKNSAVTPSGSYLGKYQTGAAVLTDQGYIKDDAYAKYGSAAVQYPSSWTGKNGVDSKESFLSNGAVQEQTMTALLNSNYNSMVKNGAIKSTDDQSTVAGMLATSHLLGAGGANNWRSTGAGADANKTTGTSYYNMGRYAVDVLAKTS